MGNSAPQNLVVYQAFPCWQNSTWPSQIICYHLSSMVPKVLSARLCFLGIGSMKAGISVPCFIHCEPVATMNKYINKYIYILYTYIIYIHNKWYYVITITVSIYIKTWLTKRVRDMTIYVHCNILLNHVECHNIRSFSCHHVILQHIQQIHCASHSIILNSTNGQRFFVMIFPTGTFRTFSEVVAKLSEVAANSKFRISELAWRTHHQMMLRKF